jgi:hypothetical protein
MGHGESAGWVLGVTLSAAITALACGGNGFADGDEGSSDDGFGGSSGSSSGGASSGQGGSISNGGVSQGGTISVAGAGGMPTCDCPVADYGLVIDGDGPTFTMPYIGYVDPDADHGPLPCGESPLRGSVARCGYAITVSACEGEMSGPACLRIDRDGTVYVSRTGETYRGLGTTYERVTSPVGVESGTATVEVTSEAGEVLVLTVGYTFCASLGNLTIVC